MNVFNRFTLRILRANRVRTLVTIIGIVLSAAMITGVTTSVSSLQAFLVKIAIETSGNWHGAVFNVDKSQLAVLENNPDVKTFSSLQVIGYALLDGIQNEYKPYVWVAGMSKNFTENMPVNLTEGRYPENPTEVILPKHLETNGGVSHEIGDTISLEIGDRVAGGYVLSQYTPFLTGEDGGVAEELEVHTQRTYTVVGFYERPGFEEFSAPGYTVLTAAGEIDFSLFDVYISLKRPATVYEYLAANFPEHGRTTNSSLLRFIGASNEQNFKAVIYGLAAVLLALIMVGSIVLIYNAFSISLSERTKQYGLLKSIGATRQQLTQSVLFEAFFLSLIGIPLGIAGGIAGIAITLKLAEDLFSALFRGLSGLLPTLALSWEAIGAAIVVGLVTVLVSAYLPAKRAVRLPAIDAIRQTSDIAVDPKKMKTSRLTLQLFGFEGMLARKNFNRNRRQYRATILSLIMSVVLFISASSFVAYIERSASAVIRSAEYDVIYNLMDLSAQKTTPQELFEQIAALDGVTGVGYISNYYEEVEVDRDLINPDYLNYIAGVGDPSLLEGDEIKIFAQLAFIDERQYEQYVRQYALVNEGDQNTGLPPAIAMDSIRIYGPEDRFYTFKLFNQDQFSLSFSRYKAFDGLSPWSREYDTEAGVDTYVYKNQEGEEVRFTADEAREDVLLQVGYVTDQQPPSIESGTSHLILVFPHSAMEAVVNRPSSDANTTLFFSAEDHKAAYEKMYAFLADRGLDTVHLVDYAAGVEADRAMLAVVNIFSFGFIALISLIAAANVFNTVSTNIGLRRREFAMLKSIGMTQKGFTKMMNYECLLYGFRALLYGIPVAFFVTFLIYRSILSGYVIDFFIPWPSVAIAVGSVFLVVFASMIYSMNKIRNDNLIDALRNENL